MRGGENGEVSLRRLAYFNLSVCVSTYNKDGKESKKFTR